MGILVGCIGFLLAVALIGVGAAVIRPANAKAGYLFIAAGAIELLTRCCTSGLSPDNLLQTGQVDYDVIGPMIMFTRVAGTFEALVIGILLAVALVLLARDATADPPVG
ncbi:MAG: hypothetical protein JRH11_05350 [Deltaproteobacteria bacterium]|nr:hypothetical protein [Deltaproteobacteria bacterium]